MYYGWRLDSGLSFASFEQLMDSLGYLIKYIREILWPSKGSKK